MQSLARSLNSDGQRVAVRQSGVALGVETTRPAMRALPGDTHHRRHMSNGHPLDAHTMHQQPPTLNGQASVTIASTVAMAGRSSSLLPRRTTTHQPTVTNMMAAYT